MRAMNRVVALSGVLSAACLGLPLGAAIAAAPAAPSPGAPVAASDAPRPESRPISPPVAVGPRVEVCFVLDTTGSMSGLIEGAKAKIWSIANQIVSAKPTPRVRFGLIGYRDRGDLYITKTQDLSDDLDGVYVKLREFKAEGGGDTPESVNQALHEAATKMSWSTDRDVLKIIFLVGDAPPHMDYAQDVKYPDVCQIAVKKDLVINTVQCGGEAEAMRIWKEIARLGEGQYAAIEQGGGMRAVSTPVDDAIASKQAELNRTALIYGSAKAQRDTSSKLEAASAASYEAQADRAAVLSKSASAAGGRSAGAAAGPAATAAPLVTGGGELLDDLGAKRVKLDELKAEELPKAMRELSVAQRKEYVEVQAKKRAALQEEINALVKKRDAYVNEQRKLQATTKPDGFDAQVLRMLQEQGQRKGIAMPQGER